jgi:D-lyxose ketol-isomerase
MQVFACAMFAEHSDILQLAENKFPFFCSHTSDDFLLSDTTCFRIVFQEHLLYRVVDFGQSGVRTLPLAAGINVGCHYKWYFCQAQLQLAILLEVELS